MVCCNGSIRSAKQPPAKGSMAVEPIVAERGAARCNTLMRLPAIHGKILELTKNVHFQPPPGQRAYKKQFLTNAGLT